MNEAAPDSIYDSAFVRELVKQLRALDTYGVQDKSTPEQLIQPFLLTRESRKGIPVVGDISPATLSRLSAFYNAVAMMIEAECSLIARPFLNVNHEGFGTVLIIVGKLVVVDKTVRDMHRFGFPDINTLKTESDKLLNVALGRIGKFPEVAGL
ncbi:MAG: NifX-associated nitrogen fixation protein [Magnetococcales bacterium]|nr:NifX-associated nitrogen fixation protein [Magnetococcales bacterium]